MSIKNQETIEDIAAEKRREAQEGCFICSSRDCQSSCPLLTAVNYGLTWDQMPYEEGGEKCGV